MFLSRRTKSGINRLAGWKQLPLFALSGSMSLLIASGSMWLALRAVEPVLPEPPVGSLALAPGTRTAVIPALPPAATDSSQGAPAAATGWVPPQPAYRGTPYIAPLVNTGSESAPVPQSENQSEEEDGDDHDNGRGRDDRDDD